MANVINRNLDGPPTQGRRKECARRLRQLARQRAPARQAVVPADMKTLVSALFDIPPEMLEALTRMDDAQVGYVEDRIETAQALVENAPAGVEPLEYAQKVLKAMEEPIALNYKPRR